MKMPARANGIPGGSILQISTPTPHIRGHCPVPSARLAIPAGGRLALKGNGGSCLLEGNAS